MLMVSRRLEQAVKAGHDRELVDYARTELYRGQCNCSYWHGAFGGCYLPHLRNAVFKCLIAAENLLDRAAERGERWIEATADDFNLDARQEIFLSNDRLATLFAPHQGGQMYELDVRSICHNLLATLARRPEAYHRKVLAGNTGSNGPVASIHDRVVFKQPGLDERVQYDTYERNSLLDHFFDNDASLTDIVAGKALERGDFLEGVYEARIRRNPGRIQVQMTRNGNAWGVPLKIVKGVTLEAGSRVLEIGYLIEGIPSDATFHFGVEFNFAGMPSGADDRYFHDGRGGRLGQLGSQLDLIDASGLNLVDEWLGIDVRFQTSAPTNFWTFPIETVSQSEGGFELVHQSVVVMPHWIVTPDANGRWAVSMTLDIDTSLAESRMAQKPHFAAHAVRT
jgi:alpha-amylase